MNSLSDQQLLREYAERRCEPAFAELVRRHVDQVYSAATRMVCDAHLAEDVTQGVFVALAQNASRLSGRPVLSGWLHVTARNLAGKAVRAEVSRRAREQEAAAMNEIRSSEPDDAWEQVAPHLDAALGKLGDSDRDAVMLRYFERKSAREMGQALGVSDEAAQKRVNRAIERLRCFLTRRGVATSAGGLALVISSHNVQAAPASLTMTILHAVSAGTAAHTAACLGAAKTIGMTTIQKAIIIGATAVALGVGIYQTRQFSTRRGEVEALHRRQTSLSEQIRQLQQEDADGRSRLAAAEHENQRLKASQPTAELLRLRGEVARWRSVVTDPLAASTRAFLAKVDRLKLRLEQAPAAKIPELVFLSEADWWRAGKGELSTDEDYRRAFACLRNDAQYTFKSMLQAALRAYMQANHEEFPPNLSDLLPYFKGPVDEAMLQRWQIAPGKNYGMELAKHVVTQKAAVDEDLDWRIAFGPTGDSVTGWKQFKAATSQP